ncbi:EAL domain-containing protein [Zoogloea sp.]|uniref:EAL domain-containing protein n=1 Tax=Zoogloea sp. TaxID=49181 RepID=UPI0025CE40C4|nr:EAL domain-containing protein [Zoogloea sp.]MCK6393168.1 EAL domain-containing protein [Zoogloea sp.]
MYFSGLVSHLRDILSSQALGFVFQPVFDLRRREVLGYETLMRGPIDSPLHTPEQLLRVARDAGLGLPLEHLAVRRAVSAFVAAGLPGRLFINLSGAMIVDLVREGGLPAVLDAGGLNLTRLVVEHMEAEPAPPAGLDEAWQELAALGCGRATGRPEEAADFLKLTPPHTRRIHAETPRREALAGLVEGARRQGLQVIAEGIEDARDLATLCALGCDCAQGYLLGMPASEPVRQLSRSVAGLLATACDRAPLNPR